MKETPPASVVNSVRAAFGLMLSQTAEAFGARLQTLYEWMKTDDMEAVRSGQSRARIKQLSAAAQLWQSLPALEGAWLDASLPAGNTVMDILKTPEVDLGALRSAYDALADNAASRRLEEGERATRAGTALGTAFVGLGARRKTRTG